ncbi:hypothetical protein AB0B07_22030 [Streptomyces sioyaensis]|uniref:hypothetical protein n=1 Tax=Streptomyces sioyaensis TaxID=67364 RepID=UPI0033CB8F28
MLTAGAWRRAGSHLLAGQGVARWSNGLAAPMHHGAWILTGINTGHVRVYASGRSANPDGASDEPVEDYLIAVWPQEPAESVVICSSKLIDEALLANAETTPEGNSHATPEPESDRRSDVRARLVRSRQDD